jgi:hypothetical protein
MVKKFHILSICLGVALLCLLLWKIGPHALWRDLAFLGWGLIPFILLEGIVDVFHTLGWRYCLSEPHRSLPFGRLFAIRMAGGSINYFTPTATLGGEIVKGTLLFLDHRGPEAASGVIIGKLSYSLSQLLFVVLGSIVVLSRIQLPAGASTALFVGSILLGAGIVGFLIVQRRGKLGTILRWAVSRRLGGRKMEEAARHITEVDGALKRFYEQYPSALPLSMFWHGVGLACSIVKTWYFLVFMTGGSFFVAAGIWFLGTWFDLLTFAVPLGIGVQEGIRVLAFRTLGFSMSLGLTYGVALRLEQIFWAGIGLLFYAALLGGKGLKALFFAPKEPRPSSYHDG